MTNISNYKKLIKLIIFYGPQLWFILFFANVGIITITRIFAASQNCLTIEEVNSDSRCLYIKSNEIYEMGSRNNPHHGHACGMDVTSIIPRSHSNNVDSYLVPNYVGPVCSDVPTAAPTHVPTQVPTQSPTQTPTQEPTQVPTQVPTQHSVANPTTISSPTNVPTEAPTTVPTQNPTSTPAQTPIPTREAISDNSFGGLLNKPGITSTPTSKLVAKKKVDKVAYYLIKGTTILSYSSLLILLSVFFFWLYLRIKKYHDLQKTKIN